MLLDIVLYPALYVIVPTISVPGIVALVVGLFLGRQQPVGPRFWFLVPLAAAETAAFATPPLVERVTNFGAAPTEISPIWPVIFWAAVLVPAMTAAWLNRTAPWTAGLLTVFVVTYALPGLYIITAEVSCRNGC